MRRFIAAAAAVAAIMMVAAPAQAQGTGTTGTGVSSSQRKPGSKPSAPRRPLEYRAFFTFDTSMMMANKSFDAVTGSATIFGFGFGGEVLNLWKTIFARGAWAHSGAGGERALVLEDEVVLTGFPIDIGIRTFEISGGWRQLFPKRPKMVLYAGAGVLFVNYRETSDVALENENVNESFNGATFYGGFEYTLSKALTGAVEAQYRQIPDALGTDGVSRVYRETDLGGFVIRGLIAYRFGK